MSADIHQPSALELERRAYRARQSTRSVLIAVISTVVFAVAVWLTVVNTPGWESVQRSFFNPETAIASLPRVWEGFLLNLQVLGLSVITVAIGATVIALLRTLRGAVFFPLRALAAGYTDVFRGIPLIIVLYLVGFGIPGLVNERIPPVILGTAAITITYSAYVSEVIRAGIEAVHPSQRLAARAMGLGYAQSLRLVVMPQALRKMTPPLMNDFVAMQKDVGLVSVIGAVDAVRAAQIETSLAYNFTPYIVAAVLFVLLAIPTIRLADWWTARLQRREQMGSIL
ncbi:amino acid ABC transporter membrane protein (PAAT family) [Microbacterium sp. SLBN-154]|uniref:amino acid ABC transporter permease n=1 Tax=Microbacterium sp. SLBN-154 TaxID=2768458 RepID=UPI00116FDB06|nr:amino acid ABC transporter permease [Microbacterium sp. SLBN-154]TQK18918.1 amino acid ABC transporter membrane protein (PAAT family) [Microbacterium sp. SLBN-154]